MGVAILYFLIGLLFMFLAFYHIEDTVWNIRTILFTAIATFDFGIAIQFIRLHFYFKRPKK